MADKRNYTSFLNMDRNQLEIRSYDKNMVSSEVVGYYNLLTDCFEQKISSFIDASDYLKKMFQTWLNPQLKYEYTIAWVYDFLKQIIKSKKKNKDYYIRVFKYDPVTKKSYDVIDLYSVESKGNKLEISFTEKKKTYNQLINIESDDLKEAAEKFIKYLLSKHKVEIVLNLYETTSV